VLDHPAVLGSADGSPLRTVIDEVGRDIELAAAFDGNPCRIPLEPLAHMLCGAIQEGAVLVARSPQPRRTRQAVGETTTILLEAIRSKLLTC
jgi:hypothetical protein